MLLKINDFLGNKIALNVICNVIHYFGKVIVILLITFTGIEYFVM